MGGATFTMFESTFSGVWPSHARRLMKHKPCVFGVFWFSYILLVNFALIRVIGGVFWKRTLEVADIDAEKVAMDNMRKRDSFACALRKIFHKIDKSGDGLISEEEFSLMLADEEVLSMFRQLELDDDEVICIFNVLAQEDGHVDYEDLLSGAMKMKCSART